MTQTLISSFDHAGEFQRIPVADVRSQVSCDPSAGTSLTFDALPDGRGVLHARLIADAAARVLVYREDDSDTTTFSTQVRGQAL